MKKFLLSLGFVVLAAAQAHALSFDSDVPATLQQQMQADLQFMGSLEGSTSSGLHQQVFAPRIDGAAYAQWFTSRVQSVGLNDCGSSAAVACVIPFLDSSKIWMTPNYTNFDHPQIARAMVIYHEARHTESQNGNWPHATCPTPFLDANGQDMKSIWTGMPLQGEPACDTTPIGSYGSAAILLKNVQKFCQNCTDKVKQDAGLFADDQFQRLISQEAIDAIKKDLYGGVAAK